MLFSSQQMRSTAASDIFKFYDSLNRFLPSSRIKVISSEFSTIFESTDGFMDFIAIEGLVSFLTLLRVRRHFRTVE